IQIKTTMRYHLTPVRMATINNSGKDRCWQGCEERGSLLYSWWECKLVQPLWKTVWAFLKKLKIELPYYPKITLSIYPRDTGVLFQRGTCTPVFIAVLSAIAKVWKEPQICGTHTHTMEYYLAIKKNKILLFATTWMELKGIMLSKISQ
ncbi:LORF2 protein, partial [Crocuta crocuta]